MPKAKVNGISLYYEDHGHGYPLIWSHEFAGDHRSWDPQVRFFRRRYRVITYSARGYPPSEVPQDPETYTQENAIEDLRGLLLHLEVEKAHVGGLSMGGNVALNFGIAHPEMTRSLIVAATGGGSINPEAFRHDVNTRAAQMRTNGMKSMDKYALSSTRIQFQSKDPKGYEEFRSQFAEHSNIGSANTFAGIQGRRRSIFDLGPELRVLQVPTLIMTGDEDDACIEPSIFMKRAISRSGLVVFPRSGHTINLEEPDLFNRTVQDFLTNVESDVW